MSATWKLVSEMTWESKLAWAKAAPETKQGRKGAFRRSLWQQARDEGLARLNKAMAGTGEGISSSDVNHYAMELVEAELWRRLDQPRMINS